MIVALRAELIDSRIGKISFSYALGNCYSCSGLGRNSYIYETRA